jgi:Ran GTPase-activating protein (RanGAP) involved in mRNA processing and transport
VLGNCGIKSEEDCKLLSQFIAENKSIIDLSIRGNDFCSTVNTVSMMTVKCIKGINDIFQGLKSNNTLQSLDLSLNNLEHEHFVLLSVYLKENTSLTKLDISNNNMEDDSFETLSQGLAQNKTLRNLLLNQNHIGDESFSLFVESVLLVNNSIKELSLAFNNISVESVQLLAKYLQSNQIKLTKLDLKGNYLGESLGEVEICV